MFAEVSRLDLSVLRTLLDYVNAHQNVAVLVYIVAEVLIFAYGLLLYFLWHYPEPASHHHGNKKTVILAIMSVIAALAIKSLIAFLVSRDRPVVTYPDLAVFPFKVDPPSFPSGHTLVAFAIASSFLFSKARRLGWLLLLGAVAIAVARVAAGVHYPSDVIAGAVIGILAAAYIHREASSLKQYLPNQ